MVQQTFSRVVVVSAVIHSVLTYASASCPTGGEISAVKSGFEECFSSAGAQERYECFSLNTTICAETPVLHTACDATFPEQFYADDVPTCEGVLSTELCANSTSVGEQIVEACACDVGGVVCTCPELSSVQLSTIQNLDACFDEEDTYACLVARSECIGDESLGLLRLQKCQSTLSDIYNENGFGSCGYGASVCNAPVAEIVDQVCENLQICPSSESKHGIYNLVGCFELGSATKESLKNCMVDAGECGLTSNFTQYESCTSATGESALLLENFACKTVLKDNAELIGLCNSTMAQVVEEVCGNQNSTLPGTTESPTDAPDDVPWVVDLFGVLVPVPALIGAGAGLLFLILACCFLQMYRHSSKQKLKQRELKKSHSKRVLLNNKSENGSGSIAISVKEEDRAAGETPPAIPPSRPTMLNRLSANVRRLSLNRMLRPVGVAANSIASMAAPPGLGGGSVPPVPPSRDGSSSALIPSHTPVPPPSRGFRGILNGKGRGRTTSPTSPSPSPPAAPASRSPPAPRLPQVNAGAPPSASPPSAGRAGPSQGGGRGDLLAQIRAQRRD